MIETETDARATRPGAPAPTSARARRAGETVWRWVERVDPEVARAVRDVDDSLLAECLRLSPLERLRACSAAVRGLGRFRAPR